MKMRNIRNGFLLVLLCGATWLLFGQTNSPAESISARGNAIVRSGQERVVRNNTPRANVDLTDTSVVHNSVEQFNMDATTSEIQSMELSRGVARIDGIQRATVVVSGNIAIVGIEVNGELEDAKLIKLKQSAEKEIKRLDPTIHHVAVTSAPDLVKRIINMDSQTADSRPDYNDNVEETVRELTPSVW